ncbi:MAG: carboxypeptidase regulatory-like domain-containing protein [Candidatus Thermoplasmatota archaeon]|nr:carboxypeptidase regulatory-like domain-containing protein [Candidatus Thermoplasmatota archaeon]
MKRYYGAIVLAMLVLVTLIPGGLWAEPTRGPEAELTQIMMDGFIAPGGQYTVGDHGIKVRITNIGDEFLFQEFTIFMTIMYYNGTLLDERNESSWISLDPMALVDVEMGVVSFPEGNFRIDVNTTYDSTLLEDHLDIIVEDVIDLSVSNAYPDQGALFPIDTPIMPRCDVTYEGNVDSWIDDVTVNLMIEAGTDIIYNETVVIMEKSGSSPRDPPYVFSNVAFPEWTPSVGGTFISTFTVDYPDHDVENNVIETVFMVEDTTTIEGIVTAAGTPLQDVEVELWISTVMIDNTLTDVDGNYMFEDLAPGTYTLMFSKRWASSFTTTANVTAGNKTVVNVSLVLLDIGGLRGYISFPNSAPASAATVTATLIGGPASITETDQDGYYEFDELAVGVYNVTATYQGYEPASQDISLFAQQWNSLNLQLVDIPFEVIDFSPPDQEPGFPVGEIIYVSFSRAIDNTTLENIILLDLETTLPVDVEYSMSADLKTVYLDPVDELAYNNNYRIQVGTFLKDVNGAFFPFPQYAEFKTEAVLTEVTVITTPGTSQTNIPVTVKLKVVFSADMDGSTINTATFRLLRDETIPVTGSVIYYPMNRTAIFTPLGNLDFGTRYLAELKNDIKPADDDYFFGGHTFVFETIRQVTTGTVSGRIVDEDGKPFLPSQVEISLVKGTEKKVSQTNLTGYFTFTDVDPGTWTLTVTIDDFKTFETTVVVTAGIERTIGIIEMEKKDEPGSWTWLIILIIILVIIVFVGVLLYLFMKKREEGVEDYGRGRRGGYGGYGYGELAEGEFMCPECQSVVGPEDVVCPSCGAEFEEDLFECPECGASLPGDAPKCPECGADFELIAEEEEEDIYAEEEREIDLSGEYEVSPLDDEPEVTGIY